MRTKTVLLSTLLGALSGVSSVMAQNVYSLNAVGYINVTLQPGFNIITDPLIASPDNTVATVLNNSAGTLNGSFVYFYNSSTGTYSSDQAATGRHSTPVGWVSAGTNVLAPGTGAWFENNTGAAVTVTFVGTVPSGPMTNSLAVGFNLVGSVVPVSGDIVTNSISALTNYALGDAIYVFDPIAQGYDEFSTATGRRIAAGSYVNAAGVGWVTPGDPTVPNVGQGFWYDNNNTALSWVEYYSVSQ